jgi:hypothetical protein
MQVERRAGSPFNFNAAAELFPCPVRKGKSKPAMSYRRFDTAAEAVRFAIEELPAPLLIGAYLEVDEERFDADSIRALYDRADYPLRTHDLAAAAQDHEEQL